MARLQIAITVEDHTNILPKKQVLMIITALAVSLLISYIDQNSIAVILPKIGKDLNSLESIQWAGTSSLIANTVFQVFYGRVSDIFGRNMVLFASLASLAVGDLACGLARTGPQLYVFRAIAGVGNGGINALAMIIVSDIVTLEDRGKYQGIIGCCVGLGSTIGPFFAAGFVESVSWRSFFFVLSGLALASGCLVYLILPSKQLKDDTMTKLRKIDYAGALFSSAMVIFLLIPISDGGTRFSWSSATFICLLVFGSLCALIFIGVECKFSALPMIPPRLFKNLAVSVVLSQNFLFGFVYYASLYYLPMYYQTARRWNALESAALLVPIVIGQSVTSILSGQYISLKKRYGRVLWFGYTVWTLAAGLRCLFSRRTSPVAIVFILLLEGAGVGCTFQPTLIAAHAHGDDADRAIIVGIRNFVRLLGGATGLAASAAIYTNVYRRHAHLASATAAVDVSLSMYALPDLSLLSATDVDILLNAYMMASRAVFIAWVPFIALCLLSTVVIRDRGLSNSKPDSLQPTSESVVP
ncbi:hypothetical protein PV11_01273 [Exophiala sideris]|uniref:Major facilitator superfamily (MFS) profile domain-containing protein n=1 Tax=Exophiala sideris TaxID=1016849 RepID=A0A0D1W9T6_9EURO|nr:hypothetical protein PV11_01273 [Exophiala sideris]